MSVGGNVFSYALAAALLVLRDPASARSNYNSAFGPKRTGAMSFVKAVDVAKSESLLNERGKANSAAIAAATKHSYSADQIGGLSGLSLVRATCVAMAAGIEFNIEAAKQLCRLSVALPILAGALAAPDRRFSVQFKPKRLEAAAVRALVEQVAIDKTGIRLEVPVTDGPVSEPILLGLLQLIGGSVDPKIAFETIVSRELKAPLIGSPANKWQTILAEYASERAPMLQPRHTQTSPDGFIGTLASALSQKAARTPSGWIAIGDAHQHFAQRSPMALSAFKAHVTQAAVDELVEISPISVGSLISDELRARSEIELGGLTYHFLRIKGPLNR